MKIFEKFKILNKSCAFCDSKELFKFYLCENCFENLNMDIGFYKKLENVDEVIVGCEYNSFIREKMVRFKFKNETYMYKVFSEILTEKIFESELHKKYNIITSVPMHKNALKKRGYNQSDLLAREVCENSLMTYKNLLKKIKDTKKQVELQALERFKNLKGVFKCEEDVDGKNIVIVDDVITTGATVNEISRELKFCGAKKVAALIVATRQF